MALKINDTEFKLLRNFIENECGITLDDGKTYLVENRLKGLLEKHGCKSFGEFYFKLKHGPKSREMTELVVDAIATNETSGRSKPSRNRLIPTNTSNTPKRKSRNISTLSTVPISECK